MYPDSKRGTIPKLDRITIRKKGGDAITADIRFDITERTRQTNKEVQ
jgi:hypothetical protein